MEGILDFDKELNISSFDQVVNAMFSSGPCQAQANRILEAFKQHPEAWKRVDAILEKSEIPQSKHIALSILEDLIKSNWNILPQEQRAGIKNFVVALIIKYSSDDLVMEKSKLFLNKLNVVLVQILKRDWPHNWPTFISEIVSSSKTNLTLCENNMIILKLLSEEIFDYSSEEMVSAKIVSLKNKLRLEFSEIYQLCHEIIEKATKPSLVYATLETLIRFVNWIPHAYIFETNLIEILVSRFLETPVFRTVLRCFTEIAGLDCAPEFTCKIIFLYKAVISGISRLLPVTRDIAQKWNTASDQDQQFIQNIALFLTTIFMKRLKDLENEIAKDSSFEELIILGHKYLLNTSDIDDRELFKICLEYWAKFTLELNMEMRRRKTDRDVINGFYQDSANYDWDLRKDMYNKILSRLRTVMIDSMVKPEEVLIVEVDDVIVREVLKESDTIFLYKSMKEVLLNLTYLDMFDMQTIMKKKLEKLMAPGTPFSRNKLNKLCWAIGSISGAMIESVEKGFLIIVLKNLISLCEKITGRDDKAVGASNVMYVVGQYPRFLRAHWKFLKTVINKLFEFMRENIDGIQDMACDTLIKIAQKCKKLFVVQQPQEPEPYIETILKSIGTITSCLSQTQIQMVYEAIGYIITAQTSPVLREDLIRKYMSSANVVWESIITQIKLDPSVLVYTNEASTITKVLRINTGASVSLGSAYYCQFKIIYIDLLSLYTVVSDLMTNEVTSKEGSIAVLNSQSVRNLRTIKKDIIRLLDSFISSACEIGSAVDAIIPMLLQTVAVEYSRAPVCLKESLVLTLMTTMIKTFKMESERFIPAIMDSVFDCTLEMINRNFEDYPDTRLAFYLFIETLISNCFGSVLSFSPERFKMIFNSLTWAFKHTLRDISDLGLSTISQLLANFNCLNEDVKMSFYANYYVNLLQDIIFILTNPFHKPGFEAQCSILSHMISLIESNTITTPLFDLKMFSDGQMTNKIYIEALIAETLQRALINLQEEHVMQFVIGIFENCRNQKKFVDYVHDFLIASKEAAGVDELELYSKEVSNIGPEFFEERRINDDISMKNFTKA